MNRSLALIVAAVASVASTPVAKIESKSFLWSEDPLSVEVVSATDVDCAIVEAAPWLAPALAFDGPSTTLQLDAGMPTPLPPPPTGTGGDCQVALVRTPGHAGVIVVPGGSWLFVEQRPHAATELVAGMFAIDRDGPWSDGGTGNLQPVHASCEAPTFEPTWTSEAFRGDVVVEAVTETDGCTTVVHDAGELSICDATIDVRAGDQVSIDVSVVHIDIDVSDGPRLFIGPPDAIGLPVEKVTTDPLQTCLIASPCGPAVPGALRIDRHRVGPGDAVPYGDGILTVVRAPLSPTICEPDARVMLTEGSR